MFQNIDKFPGESADIDGFKGEGRSDIVYHVFEFDGFAWIAKASKPFGRCDNLAEAFQAVDDDDRAEVCKKRGLTLSRSADGKVHVSA